jgi:hypothetical protein
MTQHDEAADARLLAGRDRLMEVLSTGAVFTGNLEGLSRAFRLGRDDFRVCLRELVREGQLAVITRPDEFLTVRIERRSGPPSRPADEERRRLTPNAWSL